MATNELIQRIEALNEWEELLEQVRQEADAIRDEIKQEMLARDTDEMEVGQYIVRWSSVLTQKLDTTAFKKAMPDVYKAFIKQTTSRRFSIA